MTTSVSAEPARFISRRIQAVPPSGIRKFFDLLSTIEDVISLGVGEPDYVTPEPISRAAIESIERGDTHYTSNYGLLELREKLAAHLDRLYGVRYDPRTEIVITSGSSEALDEIERWVRTDGNDARWQRETMQRSRSLTDLVLQSADLWRGRVPEVHRAPD